MHCSGCRRAAPGDARFCPSCGAAVESGTAETEARKIVTLLFCDMTDSTSLSTRLDAETLRGLMLRYFELMREQIERHGGTVEKFIGDAVMAVFGVPVLHEDDPLRAVRAAVDMRAALALLNDELHHSFGVRVGIRVGINTGEVVTSGTPSGQVMASGEAVNVAARLEQHAKGGEILLGPDTHQSVRSAVVAEPVGPLTLKGKAEPVTAYRVLGLDPDAPARAPRADGPFIGREPHLRDLVSALERSERDRCAVLVSVFGDAGVGKSRLACEFAALVAERGALVGLGRCRPYGGATLSALAEAVQRVLDAVGPRLGSPDTDTAEALAALSGGLLRDGTPGTSIQETSWAVTRLLGALGAERPVVLLLDDLQWASATLLDVVDHVADWTTGSAVVLVCVARPELLEQRTAWGSGKLNAISVTLPPLSADDSRMLVDALSEVSLHSAEAVERVVEQAEGNPLYLEQLVAMVRDSGPTDTLPPTVQALVAARLDALGHVERDILAMAATVGVGDGREFTVRALAELRGDDDGVVDTLRVLTRRRLVEPFYRGPGRGAQYRFANALILQVAYSGSPKRVRAKRHQQLAAWLVTHDGDSSGAARLDLAGTHLELAFRLVADLGPIDAHGAELRARAAGALAGAGAAALRHGDVRWAADLLERALDLYTASDPERISVALELADARLAVGKVDASRALFREVLSDAASVGDDRCAAHARLQLAYVDAQPGQFELSAALAREALPVFEQAGDALGAARSWLRIGQSLQVSGRFGDAAEPLERALTHAVSADAEMERATVLGALAISLWLGPQSVDGGIARCVTLLGEYGEGRRAVRVALSCPLAVLRAMKRDFDGARALVAVAERIVDELGHVFGAASVPVFGAAVESLAGRPDTAERLLRRASAASAQLGDFQAFATASRDLARALLAQHRPEEALKVVTLAEDSCRDAIPMTLAELAGIRARILAGRGETHQALELMDVAMANSLHTDSPVCQAMVRLDRADVLASAGDHAGARRAAQSAAELFAAKGHLVGYHWATVAVGSAARAARKE